MPERYIDDPYEQLNDEAAERETRKNETSMTPDELDKLADDLSKPEAFPVTPLWVAKELRRHAALLREVEAVRYWFAGEWWKETPDSRDFGGGPYSEDERAIGYGTYRDPRFLPPLLRDAAKGGHQ